MHGNRSSGNLCLRFGLASRLLARLRFIGCTTQLIEFTGKLAAAGTQILFLGPQLIEHGHQILLGEPFKRVGTLRAHLRRQRESENHKDHEHHNMKPTGKSEKRLTSTRPQTRVRMSSAMRCPRARRFLASVFVRDRRGGFVVHLRLSGGGGEWMPCWRRYGCPEQRQPRSSSLSQHQAAYRGRRGDTQRRRSKRTT